MAENEFDEIPKDLTDIIRNLEAAALQLNTALLQYMLAGGKLTDSPGKELMFTATELFLRERKLVWKPTFLI